MLGFEVNFADPVVRGLVATGVSAVAAALLYFIFRIWSSPRTPAIIWLIVALIVAAVVWIATFIILAVCCATLDREALFPSAPITVGPRYVCSGDPVTIAWAPNLATCKPVNCSEGSCPGSERSECPEPEIQNCIDQVCRWTFLTPTPGNNPCATGTGCPIPTTMHITADPPEAVSPDPVVEGNLNHTDSVAITPSADVTLSIDPDGPNRFRYGLSTRHVSVIAPNTFTTIRAHLECHLRLNADDPKWKLVLNEGEVSDAVTIVSITNLSSNRGFRFLFPDGTGGTFERDVGPSATVTGINAAGNIGEDTFANDNPLSIGDSECAGPDPGTTAPGRTPVVELPPLPIDLAVTCRP